MSLKKKGRQMEKMHEKFHWQVFLKQADFNIIVLLKHHFSCVRNLLIKTFLTKRKNFNLNNYLDEIIAKLIKNKKEIIKNKYQQEIKYGVNLTVADDITDIDRFFVV